MKRIKMVREHQGNGGLNTSITTLPQPVFVTTRSLKRLRRTDPYGHHRAFQDPHKETVGWENFGMTVGQAVLFFRYRSQVHQSGTHHL